MFIELSDRFILMDVKTIDGRYCTSDELDQLRAAGIRHTMMFENPLDELMTGPGLYQWGAIDRYVERALAAGFRILLPAYTAGPTWGPDSWYVTTAAGIQRGCLSPWSAGAAEFLYAHYSAMVERYAGADVAVVDTQLTFGETLLLNEPAWFGPEAVASFEAVTRPGARPCSGVDVTEAWVKDTYLAMMREHASILAPQPASLLFSALHPAIAEWYDHNGNKYYPDLFRMYRELYPAHQLLWVLYTFVQWTYLFPRIRALRDALGLTVFGGAEYAEGLPSSTPASKAAGIDGQFIGPLHPFTRHQALEPWMIANIERAGDLWRQA